MQEGKPASPGKDVPLEGMPLPASGAWFPNDPVGARQFYTFATDRPFMLEGGGSLRDVTVAYETWGTLAADGSNAVLVCHALTGDSHAAGRAGPGHWSAGWWDNLIGPGRALDTDRWFVVCANVLGGCQGSTGPASTDPATGQPYGSRFPTVTIRDMVRAQKELADHLGVAAWLSVLGGSMGGMQVLEWAIMFPERVRSISPIASCAAATAQQIAFSAVERRAISFDPRWRGGDYYGAEPGDGPYRGLALAREIAQITYRTDVVFAERFDRYELDPLEAGMSQWQRFDVEGYLDHHGAKLARRFDANSYLLLSKAMDLHDVARGRGSTASALARVRARALTMAINSDVLYWPYQQEEIRDHLRAGGVRCDHVMVDSPHGHDAFLLEAEQVGRPLHAMIEEVEKDG